MLGKREHLHHSRNRRQVICPRVDIARRRMLASFMIEGSSASEEHLSRYGHYKATVRWNTSTVGGPADGHLSW